MRDSIELLAQSKVDFWHAMPMHVAPQRRDTIEVTTTIRVDQLEAFGGGDDRGVIGDEFTHLAERMPDVSVVQVAKQCRCHSQIINAQQPMINDQSRFVSWRPEPSKVAANDVESQ